METLESKAFILRKVNYGDADLIITMLTRDLGVLSALARSARKSSKRFAGLQPLRPIHARIRRKPNRSLDTLDEAEVLSEYRGLETSLDRITIASYATELTGALLREGDRTEAFFDALHAIYQHLAECPEDDLPSAIAGFELQLLNLSGWAPRFDGCYLCGLDVARMKTIRVVRSGEGLVCVNCRSGQHYGTIAFGTLHWLQYLQHPRSYAMPDAVCEIQQITKVVRASVDRNVDKRLKSRELLDAMSTQ